MFSSFKKRTTSYASGSFYNLNVIYFIVGKRNLNLCSFSLIHEAHYNGHILNSTKNKMAEVLINLKSDDPSSRKLAKYDFSKLNLTESITLEQVTDEIKMLQEELGYYLDEYEGLARRLETFVKILDIHKHIYFNVQGDISLE